MDIDPHRVVLLLDIVHKAATAGPAYGWIVALADSELLMMKEMHDEQMTKVKSAPEPELVQRPINEGVVHGEEHSTL